MNNLLQAISIVPPAILTSVTDIIRAKDEALNQTLTDFATLIDNLEASAPAQVKVVLGQINSLAVNIPAQLAAQLLKPLELLATNLVNAASTVSSDELAPILVAIKEILSQFEGAFGSLTDLSNLDDLVLNLPGTLVTSIDKLATAVNTAIGNNPALAAALTPVMESISKLVSRVPTIFESIRNLLASVVSDLANAAANIGNAIIGTVNEALNVLNTIAANVLNTMANLVSNAISTIGSGIQGVVNDVANGIATAQPLKNLISSLGLATRQTTAALESLKNSVYMICQTISTGIQTMYNTVSTNINILVNQANAQLSQAAQSLSTDIQNAIKSGVAQGLPCADEAKTLLEQTVSTAKVALATCQQSAANLAHNAINEALKIVSNSLAEVSDLAAKLSNCATDFQANTLNIDTAKDCINTVLDATRKNYAVSTLTTLSVSLTNTINSIPVNMQTCLNSALNVASTGITGINSGLKTCLAA